MVWCDYCKEDQQTEQDDFNGFTCCIGCGRVLDDNVYGNDPTFTKTAGGQSQVEGNFVKDGHPFFGRLGAGAGRGLGIQSDSHQKTLSKGRQEVQEIIGRLAISPATSMAEEASRYYQIALERNFTRGRRTQHVAASTVYIACRHHTKPYMLIDFSDCVQTNVYVLGAVFLQLCSLLRLEEQPFMQKPVDPSLFLHRFVKRLQFGNKDTLVYDTALRLVASMKRDWMQTGRRPSGICGAALFIAAHMHGFERSKSDVVNVVHICEATLKRRLVEFEGTESGSLTAEEFEVRGAEIKKHLDSATGAIPSIESTAPNEVICLHKESGAPHFSGGLCQSCYQEFWKISGGMEGGSAPPAFQKAELLRMQIVREELRSQGLHSDDEEEDEYRMELKGSGRGLGRGRGGGRSKHQSSGVDCHETSDLLGGQVEKRGRGRPRGRGRSRVREKSRENSASSADEEAEITSALERGKGKKRGLKPRQAADVSQSGDIQSAMNSEEGAEVAEEGSTPDDDDVLWPMKFPSKRKHEIVKTMSKGKDSSTTNVKTMAGAGNGRISEQPTAMARPSLQNGGAAVPSENSGDINTDVSRVGNSNGGAEKASSEWSPATSGLPAGDSSGRNHESEDHMNDENLSDIDDEELTGYLNNDEEVRLKTIIWTEMNKDYLEQQEAKEAALAALEETRAAAVKAAASNSESAAELAAAAQAAVAQMKKDRKQRKADDAKKQPAESAAEATRQMLESKRLSTKVDYSVLAKLFDNDESENRGNLVKGKQEDDDANDSEAQNSIGQGVRVGGSQGDVSQGDSVITHISGRKSLTKEVDSKDDSLDVVNMKEEEEEEIDEDEQEAYDDDVNGIPYDYDDPGDYYDEY